MSFRFKSIWFAGLLALMFVFLTACMGESETEAESVGSVDLKTEAASEHKAQNTSSELRIGLPKDIGPLNIYTSDSSFDGVTELVLDKLFGPTPYVDSQEPWLAESAEQLDPFTWRVTIKDDIKWHDGEPFTVEDVKFTYEYYRDGPQNRHSHHVSEVPKINTIEIIDERTVEFVCDYACPSLKTVTFADLPILPKHIWEKVENPRKLTELPIGTGPYELVEYVPDQFYHFEANVDYFMGKPTVQTIYMPIIKDQTAMFNALRAGEIDMAAKSVPPELLSSFETAKNMKVFQTAELAIVELRMTYENEPFRNGKFRKAMSLAIDRETITDVVLLGHSRPADKGYPHPDSTWTNPDNSQEYNAEEAASMFDELGYIDTNGDGFRDKPNGSNMKLLLMVNANEPTWIRTAELLKEQYAKVGINIDVQVLDASTISANSSERNFDLIINQIGAHGVGDPDQFIMSHRSNYLWKRDLPYPEMDTLISEWMADETIEGRKKISFRMQELFNKQPTSLTIYYPEQNWAYNAAKFDDWVESTGYGVLHKFSFMGEAGKKHAVGAE